MILLTMFLAITPPEEMILPAKTYGEVTATLAVRIAEQTPQPGSARVRIRLSVEGPTDLAVELQPLEDALSAWKVPLRTSSFRSDERGQWECTLDLVQTKPGVVPLPGVRIRVHTGGSSHDITWPELLHEAADVSPVIEVGPPPPSPWPERLRWGGLVTLGLVSVAGIVFGVRRWVARPVPALPPLEAALAALDRLRVSREEPTQLVAELDGVLRTYLETRGVSATRMTGAELSTHLRAIPRGEELVEVLDRGEELKFAGVSITRLQVEELASRAREVLAGLEKEGRQG